MPPLPDLFRDDCVQPHKGDGDWQENKRKNDDVHLFALSIGGWKKKISVSMWRMKGLWVSCVDKVILKFYIIFYTENVEKCQMFQKYGLFKYFPVEIGPKIHNG